MKTLLALIALSLSVTVHAQAVHAEGMKGMEMKKQAKGTVHKATGVVTKIDAARHKVTIKHEPVQSMKWPAMNMAFTVKDEKLMDKLKKDEKVDFEFVQEGKDYVVTSVK
jgi:Cu/Ag efflux protein CusF